MDLNLLAQGLSYLSFGSLFLPLILLILNYKAFNNQLKALLAYISASILTEITGLYFINNSKFSLPIFYIFTLIEVSLISYMFIKEIDGNKYKSIIKLGLAIFIVSSIISFLTYNCSLLADNFSRPFAFALIFSFSLIFFYKVFIDSNISNLINYYFFWFNSAFLSYFGTNFIFFLLLPYVVTENKNFVSVLGVFHLVMSIIYNILLSIGIWKIKKD